MKDDRHWVTHKIPVDVNAGRLRDMIARLEEIARDAPVTACLSLDTEYEYGTEYTRLYVEYQRKENDEEYAKRKQKEAENAEWRRKQYELLRKEFEGE